MAFTFFFRDRQVLDSIVRHVVPTATRHSALRIWDAGCASGEEAYSMAMLLFETLCPSARDNLHIDATDIEENSQFANTIAMGVYAGELLKGSPHQDLLAKYSYPAAHVGYVEFDATLRKCIFYQRHDLLSLRSIGNDFNVVICKNVLMHFTCLQRVDVIRMFCKALAPGGYLALDEHQEFPAEVAPLFVRVPADGKLFQKAEGAS